MAMQHGEARPAARLTAGQVIAIRRALFAADPAGGPRPSQAALARAHGVSGVTIHRIKTGESWKHAWPPEMAGRP
ncbi:hypothetical protein ACFQ1E_08015 [Sphingomonas canadensis]|uniref:Uncharacterized protein n=1 Tax=Sphingomonas canadensis TaxID=1219257 RepID=A0ABW3H5Y0_9SPHN|nr:hypothetical protein [Sphingomonas canadensis]MCW3835981.1 hypothetical protein [Sphingomonas canadensis]